MLNRLHFFPGLCLLILGLGLQYHIVRWALTRYKRPIWILPLAAIATVLQFLAYLLEFHRVLYYFSAWWAAWLECAGLVFSICLIGIYIGWLLLRGAPEFESKRRSFLQAAGAGLCLAPVVSTGFGIVTRNRFRLTEVDIPIQNLPRDLNGLSIVQVSDIHLSPFLSEAELARAIDMANETRANLALVSGDLISRRGDPLDACLKQLARLRGEAGVLGCLGNHEVYTETQDYVTEQGRKIGIEFLRSQSKKLQFGSAAINFAGVDYQPMHTAYLKGAERLIAPGAINIMLSHNPDVFPVAAAQGYDLTIAGHTHGGQVNFEILHRHLNVARYFTPYVLGLYREGRSSVYVSSGLGTIGVPVRLGAAPEISLIRLCAT